MWLILAIIGHTAKALGFLGDKLFVEKLLPRPRVLAFLSGSGGILYIAAMPWFLEMPPYKVLAAALGAGAIGVFALVYFYRAVDGDEISRVVPAIGSMTPIATFALSYFLLGERFDPRTATAFAFLVAGGVLVALHSFLARFRFKNFSLISLELWVAFLFALSAVFMKYAFNGGGDVSAFLWSRLGSVGAALFLLADPDVRSRLYLSRFRNKGVRTEFLFVATRIFAGIAPLIVWVAIALGSVSLVNALQGIQYPLLFILALLFSRRWPRIFQEEMSRWSIAQKSLATLLIVIGLALLV